jgi:hypothetical protein
MNFDAEQGVFGVLGTHETPRQKAKVKRQKVRTGSDSDGFLRGEKGKGEKTEKKKSLNDLLYGVGIGVRVRRLGIAVSVRRKREKQQHPNDGGRDPRGHR